MIEEDEDTIKENMVVQVDGGPTFFFVTDIWNSTIKIASLINLNTFEPANNEPLYKLHPAGWPAKQILEGRKNELEEKLDRINWMLCSVNEEINKND